MDAGNLDWRIWRVILSGKATLKEFIEVYDVNDLCDFHEALDLELALHDAERKRSEASQHRTGAWGRR